MSAWAEKPPPLEIILGNVSLYWLTSSFPTSIWIYREKLILQQNMVGSTPKDIAVSWGLDEVKIPFGFSHFPYETAAAPKSWAESTGKISFFRNHDKGGHFAAFEQPDLMWQDIVEFVDHVKVAMKE